MEFVLPALATLACVLGLYAAIADKRRGDLPPWIAFFVLGLAFVAWNVELSASFSEARNRLFELLVTFGILIFLAVQQSLNAAYAKLLFAFSAFFSALGAGTNFLFVFLGSFVASISFAAMAFFFRSLRNPESRRAMKRHFSEGFQKKRGRSEVLVSVVSVVCYVVAAKATFAATGQAIRIEKGFLLLLVAFMLVFPLVVKSIAGAFGRRKGGAYLAVVVPAVLAVSIDVWASWFANGMRSLAVAVPVGLSLSFVFMFLVRGLNLYLEASRSKIIDSGALSEGMVLDSAFFTARFLSGKTDANEWANVGRIDGETLKKIRETVAESIRENPAIPNEIRIVKHLPLGPYVFLAAIGVSVAEFGHVGTFVLTAPR